MNKVVLGWFCCVVITIFSCTKPTDLVDNASQYPIGWTSTDTFNLVCNTVLDSIGTIQNFQTCPIGSTQTTDFGLFNSASYLQFQTTTSSLSFNYSTLDSAYLFIPYSKGVPYYGSISTPYNFEVYEMSEAFDATSDSKKMDYKYNPTPVGTLSNYVPNYLDSVYDGATKIRPCIKIPISLELAKRLIAPGSYASYTDLQKIFNGLYIKTTRDTKGFVIIETSTFLKLKLYGTSTSGVPTTSEFVTGGNNSLTINQIQRDPTSKAYLASQSQNASGSSNMYLRGLYGFYGKLKLPDLREFSKKKEIFKAEIIFYSTDTAYAKSPQLGLIFQNDSTSAIYPIDDQAYRRGYNVSVTNTTVQGIPVVEYKYNIGMFINSLIANKISHQASLRVYPYSVSFTSSPFVLLSNYVPALSTLGGNTSLVKPRLKIYYTNY